MPEIPVDQARRGASAGTLLLGMTLIGLGILWLLKSAGVLDTSWHTLLPIALMGIGVAAVVSSLVGGGDGLIGIGIILSVVLIVTNLADIPIAGGVGDRMVRPQSVAELRDTYSLMMGEQTVDLRAIHFPPGTTTVRVRHGVGELEVLLPDDVTVDLAWKVGVGDASVFGRENDGIGLNGKDHWDSRGAREIVVHLDVSVGVGSLEVRRER